MALVLVKHTISDQVVEIPEEQLAHPHFSQFYKRVRRNAAGKVYAWNEQDPDTVEDEPVKADSKVEAKPAAPKTESKDGK